MNTFDWKKPYRCKSEQFKGEVFCEKDGQLWGRIKYEDSWCSTAWMISGHSYGNNGKDLINIPSEPRVIEGWIPIFKDTCIWPTREMSANVFKKGIIACIPVKYYEGQGLEPENPKEKRKCKGWFNIYEDYTGGLQKSKERADKVTDSNRIACIEREFEYEVGEGL